MPRPAGRPQAVPVWVVSGERPLPQGAASPQFCRAGYGSGLCTMTFDHGYGIEIPASPNAATTCS